MSPRKIMVTGGGGFLGRAVVERLLARGDRIRVYGRSAYQDLQSLGAQIVCGDIRDEAGVISACRDCDVIFHVAAKAGVWGDYREYHDINFTGTCNVLKAQRTHLVPKLIYTSSPSVVFAGVDMAGANETARYPNKYRAAYPETKALAEREVLRNSNANFATIALRPHLIWGPHDNHLVPRIIARAHSLRKIGNLDPLIDCTYIDNAADAHILAADRLKPGAACAGRAYFISNGEPRPLWSIVNGILAAAELPPITKSISRLAAKTAAISLETVYGLLRIKSEPRLTRFVLNELTHAHWFDISAARRDLGYEPLVSIDEGLARLADWLKKKEPTYDTRAL